MGSNHGLQKPSSWAPCICAKMRFYRDLNPRQLSVYQHEGFTFSQIFNTST